MTYQETLNDILKEYSMKDNETHTNCPICDFNIIHPDFVYCNSYFCTEKIKRIRCDFCQTVFGPISIMQLNEYEMLELYKLVYSFFVEGNTEELQKKIFFLLTPQKNGKYLNYACGEWGSGIKNILSEGYDVYGYEPVLLIDHDKIITNFSNIPKNLDGLFSNNFIEHLKNPIKQFKEWNSLLKIGSSMIHRGEYEYIKNNCYESSNFHLLYLSRMGVEILSERTGFIPNFIDNKTVKFIKKTDN